MSAATSAGSFEDAEAALFRLACAENESYANNATHTWAELFFPEHNRTQRGLAGRLHALARRLSGSDPESRRLALVGVDIADAVRAPLEEPAPRAEADARAAWAANGLKLGSALKDE